MQNVLYKLNDANVCYKLNDANVCCKMYVGKCMLENVCWKMYVVKWFEMHGVKVLVTNLLCKIKCMM